MKRTINSALFMMLMIIVTGCGGAARDAMQKEYARLAAVTPEPPVRCPSDRALDDLGVAVAVNFAFTHKLMKEYVDATTNHREYIGFLNDVKFYMDEEKLDEKAAMEKVRTAIIAEDAKAEKEEDKVWPRVVAGIKAVDALGPENKIKEIIPVAAANLKLAKSASGLKKTFTSLDAAVIQKAVCCGNILKQTTYTGECLVFLEEQFRRVLVAKYYSK